MNYKTILVHADLSPAAGARMRLAARLANAQGAHLIGTALTGVSRFVIPEGMELGGASIAAQYEQAHREASQALEMFEAVARAEGVSSYEQRLANDDVDGGMALQARYSDLVIAGQTDRSLAVPGSRYDLPEYVLLNSPRPVLITPYAGCPGELAAHALLAWDASQEAARAATLALPLLKAAQQVTVVVFNGHHDPERFGERPGADIALYLARHGVRAEVLRQPLNIDVGNGLLSLAADINAGVLVMGGYGHARYRELLLGGATATVLQSMTIPVLMAH
jgi:nucleotide-binding universal stress UspA family protein